MGDDRGNFIIQCKGFYYLLLIFVFFTFAVFSFPSVLGFQAGLDNINYVSNDSIVLSGTGANNASIAVAVYNESNESVATNNTASDGTGHFTVKVALTNLPAGSYTAKINENDINNLTLKFKIVEEELYFRVFIVYNNSIWFVNTSTTMNSGADVADLLGSTASLSGTMHYGNKTMPEGFYHFALTDSDSASTYTKIYVDDDRQFLLYNNTEDTTGVVEKNYREKEIANLNGSQYVIAGIDSSGNEVILAKALNTTSFSSGSTAYYIVVGKNANGEIVPSKNINIKIKAPNGSVSESTGQTNAYGYYSGSLSLTSIGTYALNINDGQGMEFVNVKSFKINTKVTDLSGNPMNSFFPGATARIKSVAKNEAGIINLTSIYISISYPNGTTISSSMISDTSGYYYDFPIPGAIVGSYNVKINATYSGNTQQDKIGFSAESSSFELYTINTDYLDEVEQGGDGVFVDSFAPAKNITIMAVQTDLSKGGFESEEGMIDIENSNLTCEQAVEVMELRDEKDRAYPISSLRILVKSFENLTGTAVFPVGVTPPEMMNKQCMIVITNTTLPNGFYKLKAKLRSSEKTNAAAFSIQRILASGYTVDKNAEGFGFFSPGQTVNVKLKLTDMANREDLNGSQITTVKIVEMSRDYPSYSDVLSGITNESYNSTSGVLSFTAPNGDGFYSMKFRFKANVSNVIFEGTGSAFFELKKYIIFGKIESSGDNMGSEFKKPDENISMKVYIVDVDKGSLLDIGFESGSSQLSCTGCGGYMVNITSVFNEQLFKEVDSSDYEVSEGNILNSTSGATVNINHASDFDSGFYRVELQVYNPTNASETYTGWGFFEVRSFFVMAQQAEWNGSVFLVSDAGQMSDGKTQMQFESGDSAYLLLGAMVPGEGGGIPLNISSVSIKNVMKMVNGPPISVNYTGGVAYSNTVVQRCNEEGCTNVSKPGNIATITPVEAVVGTYMVNIEVTTTDGDKDISTSMVTFSKFELSATYRDSDSWWSPLYSNDELFNATFSASGFDGSAHNLSFAKPKFIFSEKKNSPVRINATIWNQTTMTQCAGENCIVFLNISTLPAGIYHVQFEVNDSENNLQDSEASFEVKNVVFSIPQILQSYNWNSDTGDSGTVNLNDNQDRCSNEYRNLRYSQTNQQETYLGVGGSEMAQTFLDAGNDNCPMVLNTVCGIAGVNFTEIPSMNKSRQNYTSSLKCLNLTTGFLGDASNCSQPADSVLVGMISNGSVSWLNNLSVGTNSPYNMSNAQLADSVDDQITLGNRVWVTVNASVGPIATYVYKDTRNVYFNDGSVYWKISLSQKSANLSAAHFCLNNTDGNIYSQSGVCNVSLSLTDLLVLMNSTHAIAGYNVNSLTGSWVRRGIMLGTNNQLAIGSVGYNNAGVGNYVRIVSAENYGKFIPQGSSDEMIIPSYYPDMVGQVFCVSNGTVINGPGPQPYRWEQKQAGSCSVGQQAVYVYSNGSSMWFGVNNNNLTDATAVATSGTTVNISGENWTISSLNVTQYMQFFNVKLSNGKVCGQSCDQFGCQFYKLIAPRIDSKFVFGRINLIQSPWQINETFNGAVNPYRYVYVYHNRTNIWMSANSNISGAGITIGNNITDPYGGVWGVKTLSDSGFSMVGINTLANLGSYINLSYSKSGIVRFGMLRENELGSFKNNGGRSGIDLDNDGYTNATTYYILTDANTAGVYDTFFFSTNNNFSAPLSVNANQTTRTFVNNAGGTLTLLSIDPRADSVLFYTSKIGDWADLGDLANMGNIKIPFIVQKPNGGVINASVKSIGVYYYDSNGGKQYIPFPSAAAGTKNGVIGEILLNRTAVGYNFSTGQYVFDIRGNTSNEQFVLEEWKWPRINLKSYLTSEKLGFGGWLNNFTNISYETYGEKSGVRGLELFQVNLQREGYDGQGNVTAVAESARNRNTSACTFVAPADANPANQAEIHESQQWQLNNPPYYFYFTRNASDGNRFWAKAGDCNFTGARNYTTGAYINITQGTNVYMLQVLAMNSTNTQNGPYALIGVNISNTSLVKPIFIDGMDNSGRWKVVAFNVSNVHVNAIMANTSVNSMCGAWGSECASGAVLSKTGSYASPTPLTAGDSLASMGFADMNNSTLGPNGWDGISVSNGSLIAAGVTKPIFGGNLFVQDRTPIHFKFANESVENIDLNKDGDYTDTFYIILYDDSSNNQQVLTRVIIDDDSEITPGWQSQSGETTYYDYSAEEPGITEQWGGLPNAIWSGNIGFGPEQENDSYRQLPWDQKANWEVIIYDINRMLIGKESMCGIGANDPFKVFVRVYEFNQTNKINANVSVNSVFRFSSMGGGTYNSTKYNSSSVLSDSTGYALASIAPNGQWETGVGASGADYLFRMLVKDANNVTALSDRYTRIGGSCNYNN